MKASKNCSAEITSIISSELKIIKDEIKSTNENVHELRNSIEMFFAKIDEYSVKLDKFSMESVQLKKENSVMKTKIYNIKTHITELQQYSKINNLEIHGILQTKNENINEILNQVAKCLNVDFDESQIEAAHLLTVVYNPFSLV